MLKQPVPKTAHRSLGRDAMLLLGILFSLLMLLSLLSYSPEDHALTVSSSAPIQNAIGLFGAVVADLLLNAFGYLAYLLPILIVTKLGLLFKSARTEMHNVWLLRWGGLFVALLCLCGLAHMSIWHGTNLPAGSGGILGQTILQWLLPVFGFIGTAVLLTVGLALGLMLYLEFSWLKLFERIGYEVIALIRRLKTSQRSEPTVAPAVVATQNVIESTPVFTDPYFSDPALAPVTEDSFAHAYQKKDIEDDDVTDNDDVVFEETVVHQDERDALFDDNVQEVSVSLSYSEEIEDDEEIHDDEPEGLFSDVDDEVWDVTETEPEAAELSFVKEEIADRIIPIEPLPKRQNPIAAQAQETPDMVMAEQPRLPSIHVLNQPVKDDQMGFSEKRLIELSRLLEQKLADFGVKVEVTAVAPGPVITRFEIQPAPGVKASKITNLARDLARSMAMISVRVVEVIPGKSVMGIEVPNEHRALVSLHEVLASDDFDQAKSPLTLALGHDIGGNPVITDLAKMPHLLVAGTTGSGKSVGVNAMILSMLFKATPEQLRLILVDPKMLELSVYEGIPHLLTPVVTDMSEASNALRWSVAEMERRYLLMSKMGVRNLAGFNKKVKDAIAEGQPLTDPLWEISQSFDTQPPLLEPLPYIVIVIDEFADMMMMVGKKVEEQIARIAQKARAAGVHMILATQRPSVDVITGLIKANIPTRMAFQVSSKIDSRTILDQGGAEQLLGHGDMLFMPPGLALPERVHGAFVADEEVHSVVAEWKKRGAPAYIEDLTRSEEELNITEGGSVGEQDELYDLAVAFVLESGKCSISSVQRKCRIGYNRAANLVEAMEAAGVVSAPAHNGTREVLVGSH